jgi:GNAT superfamily N-acetyltransferase
MIDYAILTSHDATQGEFDDFVRLVRQGGAVDEHYVRQGIQRKGAKIVLARIERIVVGVAALKVPSKRYRNGIESGMKSGHPIPQNEYPYELGYVAVSQLYGGLGIGKVLVAKVLELSDGQGLFATTSHPAMKDNLLPDAGFEPVGTSWANDQNKMLRLFTINA